MPPEKLLGSRAPVNCAQLSTEPGQNLPPYLPKGVRIERGVPSSLKFENLDVPEFHTMGNAMVLKTDVSTHRSLGKIVGRKSIIWLTV